MSTTPIFDQLCQELGNVTELEVSAGAIGIGSNAVAEPEPGPALILEESPILEEEETVAEWLVPEEYWDTVHRFDEFPTDSNER
ncbi:MAG: hypothetical protein ACT4NY_13810 [Pseudonocardiales bacterium]